MLKWAWLALIALWSVSFQQGCSDLKKSLTHLTYYPIRDMRQTIVVDPQRIGFDKPDSLSVPTIGRTPYESDPVPYEIAGKKLTEAFPSSDVSIARGDSLFHTVCWSCHGKTLAGDGPIVAKFIPPPDLLAEGTRSRTDGYLWSYMRRGGAVMPAYGNAISAHDAWDIVHYIRHMQKVSPR